MKYGSAPLRAQPVAASRPLTPRWGWVYALGLLLLGLLLVERHQPLTRSGHLLMQCTIVLLVYGLMALWVQANCAALSVQNTKEKPKIVAVTGIAQVVMPFQANGSVIMSNGQPIGAALIGQPFDDPNYFWGRPSATGPFPYNAAVSSGSNLGPTNPVLVDAVTARVEALRAADPNNTAPIPVDLVTASGSGLDPHISVAAARYQVERVAQARGLSPDHVRALVEEQTEGRQFGLLGEPRVNVLALNLALDALP